MAASGANKGRPQQNVGILARKASGRARNGSGPAFVIKHKANSMVVNTSKSNEVWFVDSGASKHMTSHEEWFFYLEKPEKQEVVETRDDFPHTIEHVGEVPLSHSSG